MHAACIVSSLLYHVFIAPGMAADDGYLDANDLQQSFGRTADVKQMIAAADKNGDGKVSFIHT